MELAASRAAASGVLAGAIAGSEAAPVESSAGGVFLPLLSPVRAAGVCTLLAGATGPVFPESLYIAITRACPEVSESTAGNGFGPD